MECPFKLNRIKKIKYGPGSSKVPTSWIPVQIEEQVNFGECIKEKCAAWTQIDRNGYCKRMQ